MAGLNQNRFRYTAGVIATTFLLVLFTKSSFKVGGEAHEVFEYLGNIFIALCMVGRVYSTAFLGGYKNQKVIDYGPFSVCRNPLYFFSFVGVVGICLISTHLLILLLTPLAFVLIYAPLIKREEVFLQQTFGDEYAKYKQKTPCFIPNPKLYHAPEEVSMRPKALLSAAKDSTMWLLIYPLMELIEKAQEIGLVEPLFLLP